MDDSPPGDKPLEVIESLKSMLTGGSGSEIQSKGVDQITTDICADFILNSNYKNLINKNQSDRRFAILNTHQQSVEDLKSDGMDGVITSLNCLTGSSWEERL